MGNLRRHDDGFARFQGMRGAADGDDPPALQPDHHGVAVRGVGADFLPAVKGEEGQAVPLILSEGFADDLAGQAGYLPARDSAAAWGIFLINASIGAASYSSMIWPSVERVTMCQGIILPLFCSARTAALARPPQQGTSMRATVTLLMSFSRRMAVSLSA